MNLDNMIQGLGALTVAELLRSVGADLSALEPELRRVLPVHPVVLANNLLTILDELLTGCELLHSKRKFLVLGPELLVVETLVRLYPKSMIYVVVDSSLTDSQVSLIADNVPSQASVHTVRISDHPRNLTPKDSIILAVGFDGGYNQALISITTWNMLTFFQPRYFGEFIMVNPLPFPVISRPDGWLVDNLTKLFTGSLSLNDERGSQWIAQAQ